MEKVARLADAQRRELFSEAAARLGMTPAVVEKDFWVTWTLARLFATPELARVLMFKGGTSLSKAYRLIERFSEDIDLILDWRILSGEDPLAPRSKDEAGKAQRRNQRQGAGPHRRRAAGAGVGRARRALRLPRERGRSACDRDSLCGGIPRHLPAAGNPPGDRAAGGVAAA
jgi:hypothetical protein